MYHFPSQTYTAESMIGIICPLFTQVKRDGFLNPMIAEDRTNTGKRDVSFDKISSNPLLDDSISSSTGNVNDILLSVLEDRLLRNITSLSVLMILGNWISLDRRCTSLFFLDSNLTSSFSICRRMESIVFWRSSSLFFAAPLIFFLFAFRAVVDAVRILCVAGFGVLKALIIGRDAPNAAKAAAVHLYCILVVQSFGCSMSAKKENGSEYDIEFRVNLVWSGGRGSGLGAPIDDGRWPIVERVLSMIRYRWIWLWIWCQKH